MTNKNPAAVHLGRLGGLKGGPARAKSLSAAARSAQAKRAARARWYGPGHFERAARIRRATRDLIGAAKFHYCDSYSGRYLEGDEEAMDWEAMELSERSVRELTRLGVDAPIPASVSALATAAPGESLTP